jgi:hypothetical protein
MTYLFLLAIARFSPEVDGEFGTNGGISEVPPSGSLKGFLGARTQMGV